MKKTIRLTIVLLAMAACVAVVVLVVSGIIGLFTSPSVEVAAAKNTAKGTTASVIPVKTTAQGKSPVATSVGQSATANLGKCIVYLDAGHGGKDDGTSYGSLKERDIALKIAKYAKQYLQDKGFEVIMLREKDEWVSLYKRSALINISTLEKQKTNSNKSDVENLIKKLKTAVTVNSDDENANGRSIMDGLGVSSELSKVFDIQKDIKNAVVVSVHVNSVKGDSSVRGLQVLYSTSEAINQSEQESIGKGERMPSGNVKYTNFNDENDRRFAQAMYQSVAQTVPELKNAGITTLVDKNLALLREQNLPGVLVEMGFISNEGDREIMKSDTYQKKMAQGIMQGVQQYFGQ